MGIIESYTHRKHFKTLEGILFTIFLLHETTCSQLSQTVSKTKSVSVSISLCSSKTLFRNCNFWKEPLFVAPPATHAHKLSPLGVGVC